MYELIQISEHVSQYALIGSTVRSYLSCLRKQGRVDLSIIDNKMFWTARVKD